MVAGVVEHAISMPASKAPAKAVFVVDFKGLPVECHYQSGWLHGCCLGPLISFMPTAQAYADRFTVRLGG